MLLLVATLHLSAQTNGTNSPYSRFGLGNLKEASQGFNKGMGGVALGFRDGGLLNKQNPASYSAIDSLAFIFDLGMSLQSSKFKSGGNSVNTLNTSLDYIHAGFRLRSGIGFTFGFMPYTSMGYNFSEKKKLSNDFISGNSREYVNQYLGNGGIHEVFVGLGWNPFADLSIGANIGYIWGGYNQDITQTFYENGTEATSSKGLRREIDADISSYKLDFGIQYPIKIGKDNVMTLGATYGLGHSINSPAHYYNYIADGDTTKSTIEKAFEIPMSFGGGISWKHKEQWVVGVDVTHQKWSDCNVPQIINEQFVSTNNGYQDRTRIAMGGEFQPDKYSNKYLRRVQYRLGASYTTPYYKVNGTEGPREFSLSAGVSLPVSKISRSLVNVGLQWIRLSPGNKSLITENNFVLNVGITFNERWFMKWKIQ